MNTAKFASASANDSYSLRLVLTRESGEGNLEEVDVLCRGEERTLADPG